MSRENVEVVVAMVEAWARGDRESARRVYDPDVVFRIPVIDSPIMQGLSETEGGLEEWRRTWDDYGIEVLETIDVGEVVVAIMRQHGVGKDADAPVELLSHGVFTLRDSKIVRVEFFNRREEALEAAGLEA